MPLIIHVISNKMYFKITNKDENHNGFQYRTGLNILKGSFAQVGSCVPGGLYFTDINHILKFLSYGVYLREVSLPIDDNGFKMVADDDDKWRANKIILGQRYELNKVETWKYLVEKGANLHANDILYWVAIRNYAPIVKFIVEMETNKKNNVNAVLNRCGMDLLANKYYDTLCHLIDASSNNDYSALRKLIDPINPQISSLASPHQIFSLVCNGITTIDEMNNYLLRRASETGDISIAIDLVVSNAQIDTEDNYPLRWAARNGHLQVVEFLIENGADPTACCNYASRKSKQNGHYKITEYLEKISKKI